MAGKRVKPVRMGGDPGIAHRKYIITGGIGAILVLVIVIVAVSTSSTSDDKAEETGCKSDDECGPRSICAAGGCLILISSEQRSIWHEDVEYQLNPPDGGPPWQPQPTFGEKLVSSTKCPAPSGKVDTPERTKVLPLAKATVFEIEPTRIIVHKHQRARGSIWIDALRFWMPGFDSQDEPTICSSKDVAHIAVGKALWRGKTTTFIDAALSRVAPAGVVASAGVSVKRQLPPADKEGLHTLEFTLEPVIGVEARFHTIVTIPLGTELSAISGPPPTQQRLLIGYVAYYWEHTTAPSEISVSFRPASKVHSRFDITKLNP
ncbi:MAG: hypothetical protein GY854_05550 [Deltaproteobacteria bacterium]|nr:hypothetical protein [Deltaproteobacteria bacterium]